MSPPVLYSLCNKPQTLTPFTTYMHELLDWIESHLILSIAFRVTSSTWTTRIRTAPMHSKKDCRNPERATWTVLSSCWRQPSYKTLRTPRCAHWICCFSRGSEILLIILIFLLPAMIFFFLNPQIFTLLKYWAQTLLSYIVPASIFYYYTAFPLGSKYDFLDFRLLLKVEFLEHDS